MEWPVTPIMRPVVGAVGRTGSWRVFRPVIDHDKCVKCLQCWLYCPDTAIIKGERIEINYEYCKGCGICANVCPVKAIRMVREGG